MTRISLTQAKNAFPEHNIEEHVDSGGQKDVFKGVYDGQDIVLKTVVVNGYEATKRAEREIEAMQLIDSPILVDFVHAFPDKIDGDDVFVMVEDFVSGPTLREKLDDDGPSLQLGLNVAERLLTVLKEFNSKGLVHRDIKPRNIIISPDSGTTLLDVGIVRFLNEEGLTPTFRDRAPGTLHYSAPEQLENDSERQSIRTDIFATGVVLFECITGEHPFKQSGMDVEEAILAGDSLDFIDHIDLSEDIAEDLNWVLNNMIQEVVNERFRKPSFATEEIESIREEYDV